MHCFQDIQLSESPILIKLMDGEVGIMVVGYKHHWEVLESNTGQVHINSIPSYFEYLRSAIVNQLTAHLFLLQLVKRAENSEDSGPRRGTLVNALRIGDERDGQIVLCYNRKWHLPEP